MPVISYQHVAGEVRPHLTRSQEKVKTVVKQRPDWLTGANIITLLRIPFTIVAVFAILGHDPVGAFVWTLLGISTDFVDGFVAKHGWLGGTSELGKVLDPLLDKPMILVPGFTVAIVLILSPLSQIGLIVALGLTLIVIREVAVFIWKKAMVQREGLQSAGQHGRASMTLQCVGLLLLIPSAMAALSTSSIDTMLSSLMLVGMGLGMMVAASFVAGWVYYGQWREMTRSSA